ncbi:MAG: hypothetical protein HY293_20135 [Planctomycetes bacterium]|nr:hypothetical protein [Planctomycetota bacterium]
MNSDSQTLVVNAPPGELFEFLAAPENLPKWAVKFCHSIHPRDRGGWCVQGCMGEVLLRYAVDRASGVIDYHVATPGGEALIPTRVIPLGAGAAYLFTQFQPPGLPDEAFREQVASLKEEFRILKRLMESGRRNPG